MQTDHLGTPQKLLTLSQAAQKLGLSVETLIRLNNLNILKPALTVSGVVGYYQNQIDEFQKISTPKNPLELPQSTPPDNLPPEINPSQAKLSVIYSLLTYSSAAAIIVLITIVALTQKDGFRLLGNTISSQLSSFNFSDPYVSPVPIPQNSTSDPSRSLELTYSVENTIPQLAYAQTISSDSQETSPAVFDPSGNLTGSAPNPNLLAALGSNSTSTTSELARQPVDPFLLLIFLCIGLLTFSLFVKPQPAYTTTSAVLVSPLMSDQTLKPNNSSIAMEIVQKTDGTVVILAQGREFKVSKPELDSESDRFIQRLMQLTSSGIKEFDYDSSIDTDIVLNSPLRKIVTRLGFVGNLRDVFFPRTSKTRVLFRKYLTQFDLEQLHLTPKNILSA